MQPDIQLHASGSPTADASAVSGAALRQNNALSDVKPTRSACVFNLLRRDAARCIAANIAKLLLADPARAAAKSEWIEHRICFAFGRDTLQALSFAHGTRADHLSYLPTHRCGSRYIAAWGTFVFALRRSQPVQAWPRKEAIAALSYKPAPSVAGQRRER